MNKQKVKTYIIGDPVIRERLRETGRLIVKCTVGAFALIGFAAILTAICQICAW